MKVKYRFKKWVATGLGALSLTLTCRINGQTLINLGTQGRNIDFSNAVETRPARVGTSLPPTCSTGDLFFNTAAAAGQNLFGCASLNTWAQIGQLPALTGDITTTLGSTATALNVVNSTPGLFGDATHSPQVTVDAKGRVTAVNQISIANSQVKSINTALTPRPALNYSNAFTISDNSAASQTELDLATVNATPGTFGSPTQVPIITVNGRGQITAVSTTSTTASSSTNAGTLSSIPSSCSAGALYVATDQPTGQQLYICSSSSNWTQFLSLGGSGSLAFTNGSLDIVPGVVPRLTAANSFTGLNSFSNGIRLTSSTASKPACALGTRGLFWFLNNGASKDGVQVCVYDGSNYNWINLY